MSAAQISTLLVLWSLAGFVLEVPSGAWADTVDRRTLLVLSAVVYAAAFASWMLAATYVGFAVGFVLWGASSALMSGTFEALLYDELTARGRAGAYAGLMGWAHSAAMIANLVATAAAAPLFAWGGYALVGWTSVAIALVHGVLALLLPRAAPVDVADQTVESTPASGGLLARWSAMLHDGLGEVRRRPRVRHAVLISAAILGLTAYDEYFPLMMRESGIATGTVPIVLAVIVGAQALGTGLAGRTEAMASRTMGRVLAVAVVAMSIGAVAGSYAGFAAIAVGYGLINNLVIVSEARLQHTIESDARATVTSVAGVSTEVFAISVYAVAGLGSLWWSVSTVVAAFGLPALVLAALVPRWMPPRE